jgi:hypothetical protein
MQTVVGELGLSCIAGQAFEREPGVPRRPPRIRVSPVVGPPQNR